MSKAILMGMLAVTLGGCYLVDREIYTRDISVIRDGYYTRPEVDAINAEMQCRQLARTLLEISRCGVRR